MCQFQGRDFLHIIKWFAINFHHFTFTHKIQIIRTRLHRDTCCILLSDYKNCYKGLRLVNYACDVHPFSWLYMQLLPAGGKTCFITFSFENQWFFFSIQHFKKFFNQSQSNKRKSDYFTAGNFGNLCNQSLSAVAFPFKFRKMPHFL